MPDFDPDHPGCAPETCGGVRYDPCVTVLRTRGRWHDGEVPDTVAHAVENAMADEWDRVEAAPRIVAVVADWIRAQPVQPQLRDPQKHGFTNAARWAAAILDDPAGT